MLDNGMKLGVPSGISNEGGGTKYDGDKPRMDLLDPTFTIGVSEVLTFGARKYAPDNWRNGIKFSRLIASLHRHLASIQAGEDIDPESGLPHIYHLGCNVQFLGWMMKNRPDLDDRYKMPESFELNQLFAKEANENS